MVVFVSSPRCFSAMPGLRVDDVVQLLEAFKTEVFAKLQSIEDKIQGIAVGNEKIEARLKWVEDKLTDLENRSRRENLLFFGIPDDREESWASSEEKISTFLKEKLGLDKDIVFHRVHRIGKYRRGANARPIIAKLLLSKDKELIMKNVGKLKDTGFSISEDFCQVTRDRRKLLLPHLKKAKSLGKKAVLRVDTLAIDGVVFHVDDNVVKNRKTGRPITWEN